jgi:hypothetical protein
MFALSTLSPLVAEAHLDPAETQRAKKFLRLVLDVMLIVSTDASERRELLQHISQMPPDLQLIWTEVLRASLLRATATKGVGMCACPVVNGLSLDMHVLDTKGDVDACVTCGHERVPWPDADAARAIDSVRQRRHRTVPVGTSRDALFDNYLAPMLLGAMEVTIIDRYAGKSALSEGASGTLSWLLSRIWGIAPCRVILLTGSSNRARATYSRADVTSACRQIATTARSRSGASGKLGLWTADDKTFMRHSHDRFLGVAHGGREMAVTFGKGLDVFREATTMQASSVQLLIDDNVIDQLEIRLGFKLQDVREL